MFHCEDNNREDSDGNRKIFLVIDDYSLEMRNQFDLLGRLLIPLNHQIFVVCCVVAEED
jgi:hypothetical protein